MSDAAPPPTPPAAPAPPPRRPDVPLAATCLTWVAGAGILFTICAGGALLGMARGADRSVARTRAKHGEAAKERDRVAETKKLLDLMGARIQTAGHDNGELPETLEEAPPKDAWGHPVRYERTAQYRAVITSAGPDG